MVFKTAKQRKKVMGYILQRYSPSTFTSYNVIENKLRQKRIGNRFIKFNVKGKIKQNISYQQHIKGIHLQRENKIREAKKSLFKQAVSHVPVVGPILEAQDVVKNIDTLLKGGKT